MPDVLKLRWDQGDSSGGMTAIYALVEHLADPTQRILIGVAESWELAEHIVVTHNASLED